MNVKIASGKPAQNPRQLKNGWDYAVEKYGLQCRVKFERDLASSPQICFLKPEALST
jgi:hypothetical protein